MRRFVPLALLAYALLLLGLASLRASFVILAIPLVVYLVTGILRGPEDLNVAASRTLSRHRARAGMPLEVVLRVTNHGGDLEEVRIEDLLPAGVEVIDGHPSVLTALPAGAHVELRYTISANRGVYRFRRTEIVASDLFGVLRRQTTLTPHSTLLILPEVMRLGRLAIRPLRTHGYAGPIPSRRAGAGVEFHGVREYAAGDPLRWINWRMTARHPRALYSNEFEQERVADVGLILDARLRTNLDLGGESLLDPAVSATAALANAFLEEGNRVGLLIYGWYLDWTFPGYGKTQRERILRSLARARAGNSVLFETLDYLPVRNFPVRSQIVVVSPLCADDYEVLARLRARGYQVLVVSPDPIAFELRRTGEPRSLGELGSLQEPDIALAARIARADRALLLARLRRIGIRIVDWDVSEPLESTLRGALGRRHLPERVVRSVVA
jgi:uncharacterized protein (DUF58 family)